MKTPFHLTRLLCGRTLYCSTRIRLKRELMMIKAKFRGAAKGRSPPPPHLQPEKQKTNVYKTSHKYVKKLTQQI